jgi:uncharacterized lipoprotein YbaY
MNPGIQSHAAIILEGKLRFNNINTQNPGIQSHAAIILEGKLRFNNINTQKH